MEKKEPKIKILVACHKADPAIRQDDIYMPIHVGKALHPELDLGFQGDDTGDNISKKNGSYCELTAMYWAWKNLPKDVDIVGLCHYRRYFKFKRNSKDAILKALETNDVIAIRPYVLHHTNINNLVTYTTLEDAVITVDTLIREYPADKDLVLKYFFNSNHYSIFNMLIMRRDIFNNYCALLFPLLLSIEKRLRSYPWSRLQRNVGYIGEALMGFLFSYMKLKVKYIEADDFSEKKSINKAKLILSEMLRNMSYRLYHFKTISSFNLNEAVVKALKQEGVNITLNE